MPEDPAPSEENYHRFIERVRASGEVWGLCCDEAWAFCPSHEYEDTEVLVFWSDRAAAQKLADGEWSEHVPTAIPLDEFIDRWLRGMDEDGVLVGLDWDAGLSGLELEPIDVVEQLGEETD